MRVYGMWGLSTKNKTLAITQIDRFFQDASEITQTSGCITMTLPIYYIATSKIDSVTLAQNSPKSPKP